MKEKVTEEFVATVKADLESGLKPKAIAEKYNVKPTRIYSVISRFKIGVKKYSKKVEPKV